VSHSFCGQGSGRRAPALRGRAFYEGDRWSDISIDSIFSRFSLKVMLDRSESTHLRTPEFVRRSLRSLSACQILSGRYGEAWMADAVYATAVRLALEGSSERQRRIATAFLEQKHWEEFKRTLWRWKDQNLRHLARSLVRRSLGPDVFGSKVQRTKGS
jgi:hypothetical protein